MTLQDLGFTSPLPLILITLLIGFILGWLITGLPPRSRLAKSQSHAQELDASLNQAKASLAEATAQVTALQRESAAKAAAFERESAAAAAQANALQAEVATAHQHELEQAAALSAARANLDKAGAQVESLQQELAAREAELTDLKLQDAALRSTAQQSYGALSGQNQTLQAEIERVCDENETLKANLEGTAKDLARARADLDTVKESVANKDTALTEAYARAVRLERESSDEQSQLLALQAEIAGLKRNVTTLTAANQELHDRLENARGEVAGELAALTSTMLRIKDEQLAQANATITALQAQMAAPVGDSVPS